MEAGKVFIYLFIFLMNLELYKILPVLDLLCHFETLSLKLNVYPHQKIQ